ncbi:MAG TPA: hypothetical protein VJ841_02850 [Candidatus Saccharimonadales bacterium]|nr:hypothetical protein [Candidatus Saccharimonadales bacterium]
MRETLTTFAVYGCGTYGADAYSHDCQTTTTPSQPTDQGVTGALSNTGYNIIIPAALAAALIIAGSIYLMKKYLRRRARSTS